MPGAEVFGASFERMRGAGELSPVLPLERRRKLLQPESRVFEEQLDEFVQRIDLIGGGQFTQILKNRSIECFRTGRGFDLFTRGLHAQERALEAGFEINQMQRLGEVIVHASLDAPL